MALVGEHEPLPRCRCQAGGFVQQLGHLTWAGGNPLGGQVAWLGVAQHHLRHFCKQRRKVSYFTRTVLMLLAAAMTLVEALCSSAALSKYLELSMGGIGKNPFCDQTKNDPTPSLAEPIPTCQNKITFVQ